MLQRDLGSIYINIGERYVRAYMATVYVWRLMLYVVPQSSYLSGSQSHWQLFLNVEIILSLCGSVHV